MIIFSNSPTGTAIVSGVELSPGVVIDPNRREAYVMSPDGGIVALDLVQGMEIWRSQEAAKPLAISGDLLIGQAEAEAPGEELGIVALDTAQRGAPVSRNRVSLPSGVQPMIAQSMNRAFTARAEPGPGEANVSWEFIERPLRGVSPDPLEVLPGETPPAVFAESRGIAPTAAAPVVEPGAEVVTRGTFRLDLASGSATSITAESGDAATMVPMAAPASATAREAEPRAPLADVPEPQFLSADRRHVMHSKRVGDDTVWDKYLWSIYDHATSARLGEVRAPIAYAPFVVAESRIIYQTNPHAFRAGSDLVEEPLQIRAVDLQTGEILWRQPVRDTADREPPPP